MQRHVRFVQEMHLEALPLLRALLPAWRRGARRRDGFAFFLPSSPMIVSSHGDVTRMDRLESMNMHEQTGVESHGVVERETATTAAREKQRRKKGRV